MGKHWEKTEWPSLVASPHWRPPLLRREVLPPAEDWMARGACVGRWPEWDHTIDGENHVDRAARHRRAAEVCNTACPVLEQCRNWADSAESVGQYGVCAGRLPKRLSGPKTPWHWADVA